MSAPPTRRAISQAAVAVVLVCGTAVLCFRSGGYFHEPRTTMAIGAWVLVALAALAAPSALVPPGRAGRIALAGLLGLAAWTALSTLWAPLEESAREDAFRLALYAAVLPLAVAAFRVRAHARALEPALAGLALVVVGYGLVGELGLFDVAESVRADGRLEQPLSYWNAMGAMGALGIVLAARAGLDSARAPAVRAAAVLACPVLAVGTFLTYSRGAVASALVGLAVLALLAPESSGLWRRAGGRARSAAGWAVTLAAVALLVAVAGERAAPPAEGATAARFADVGSNRADYWEVAAGALADHPLAGVGAAGFRVEWLRERDLREGVADAHSLYVETGAELGIVGLALLATFAGGLAAALRRVHRSDPALAAGPAAALAALALHAGLDWDWELPALALPALMLAGAALGAEPERIRGVAPRHDALEAV